VLFLARCAFGYARGLRRKEGDFPEFLFTALKGRSSTGHSRGRLCHTGMVARACGARKGALVLLLPGFSLRSVWDKSQTYRLVSCALRASSAIPGYYLMSLAGLAFFNALEVPPIYPGRSTMLGLL
jgi:hypothetical protein